MANSVFFPDENSQKLSQNFNVEAHRADIIIESLREAEHEMQENDDLQTFDQCMGYLFDKVMPHAKTPEETNFAVFILGMNYGARKNATRLAKTVSEITGAIAEVFANMEDGEPAPEETEKHDRS